MAANLWFWIAFTAGVLSVLAIDLFGFQRQAHRPSTKEAALWTLLWVVLSLGFNVVVWYWMGPAKAVEFLTGYLIEYSLSVDNIFVFVLIFSYFAVPAAYQHRVLFWGILSALVLRGVIIGLGIAFIEAFDWTLALFGVFLLLVSAKMLFRRRKAINIGQNPLVRLMRRWLPVTDDYHGANFTIRSNGRRILTPLAMVLITVEATDVLFAVDSIPAIFGVTRDPFIVYSSNVCAIMGLRSLYFLLAGMVHRFVYLKPALAIILGFIGTKMLLAEVFHVPTAVSLSFIALVLSVATLMSLRVKPRSASAEALLTRDEIPSVSNLQ
jgi:tellurite resistance protein TerC